MRAPLLLLVALLALVSALRAPAAQAAPGCASGPGPDCRVLAAPAGTPAVELGSPNAPDDDLEAALRRLAAARDATVAAAARDEALAILEGTPLPGRAYDGLPLLNWNAPAKVKDVPAGGLVEVREVRFPGHALSDTWLLRFADPSLPYTIRYVVSELGGVAGGELAPAPLLTGGAGSTPAAVEPLMPPELFTGTWDVSRFTQQRGLTGGGRESSRLAEQVVDVAMPAPGMTHAILQPSSRAGALAALRPWDEDRAAAAEAAFGFSGEAPTAAEREAAIRRLAPEAPERLLWDDLRGDLDTARARAAGDVALVDAMRARDALPAGIGADPEADVTLVVQNGEIYASAARLRPRGGRVRVRVLNRDGFARTVSAVALHGREPVRGALDWGRFDWKALPGATLGAGETTLLDLAVPSETFALWLGDADRGDQAAALVELETGPRVQSIAPTPDVSANPLHQAVDANGDFWLALAGADAVVRLTPAADLEQSVRRRYLIPGGRHTATGPQPPLEPSDIAVDHRGIVWTTLALGNAIARIDPARAQDDSTAGVTVYPLPPCGEDQCPPVFPPEPGARPTREPVQMELGQDADGNTLVWFAEVGVDSIGLLRVAPDGRKLGETHFACDCGSPFGIGLDQAGDVWFTEGVTDAVGRITLDAARPYAAAAATVRHYPIPGGVLVEEPELSPVPVVTTNAHSLAIDRRGLIWFSQSATGKLGFLDPEQARPGTEAGFGEVELPATDFGTAAAPADLVVDRAGMVFWADEYGDVLGTVDARGPRATWAPGRSLRPAARRSLTDSPLVDPAGDLWFLEAGDNRITRVSDVSAGNPVVAPRPDADVDLASGAVALSGLEAEAEAVDVTVVRDGREVARRAGVAVAAGAARVALGELRAGDVLAVQPRGTGLHAAFSTRLPALTARVSGTRVVGAARLGDRPLAGAVVADDGRRAALDLEGAFAFAAPAARTVTWTGATPGARWRVRAAVTPAAPVTPPVEPVVPEPPVEPRPVTPEPPAPPVQPVTPPVATPAACPEFWLADGRPAFLRLTVARAEACLGRPLARRAAARRYAGGIELTIRAGRVAGLVLTAGAWRSERGGLAPGAAARAIRAALPGARVDRRLGVHRAVLPLAGGRAADVRVTVRAGRVERIEARDVARGALDRLGRRLLRSAA